MAFSIEGYGQQSEINVTPLIDVLLVLLIIFMVIVPVTPRGLESQVPKKSQTPQSALGPVSVELVGDGSGHDLHYTVDGRAVPVGDLRGALLERLRLRANRSVYVAASPDLSYQLVAEAVGAARAAGATTVGLGRASAHS